MDTTLVIGIIGSGIILIAFILNQLGTWKNSSVSYDSANLAGASLLVLYAYLLNSYPFLILNLVWAGVSLKDVLLHLSRKK